MPNVCGEINFHGSDYGFTGGISGLSNNAFYDPGIRFQSTGFGNTTSRQAMTARFDLSRTNRYYRDIDSVLTDGYNVEYWIKYKRS